MNKIVEQQEKAANGNGGSPAPTTRASGYRSQLQLEEEIVQLQGRVEDAEQGKEQAESRAHDLEHQLEEARQNITAMAQRANTAELHEREASRAERILRKRVVELAEARGAE